MSRVPCALVSSPTSPQIRDPTVASDPHTRSRPHALLPIPPQPPTPRAHGTQSHPIPSHLVPSHPNPSPPSGSRSGTMRWTEVTDHRRGQATQLAYTQPTVRAPSSLSSGAPLASHTRPARPAATANFCARALRTSLHPAPQHTSAPFLTSHPNTQAHPSSPRAPTHKRAPFLTLGRVLGLSDLVAVRPTHR